MARAPFCFQALCLGLAVLLAGCAGREAAPETPAGFEIVFTEVEAPDAYAHEGTALSDPDGAPGLWAVVPGLPRPERGAVRNVGTGARVVVALYAAPRGSATIRLSGPAAEALGISDDMRVPVAVVALRREPRIVGQGGL